MVGLSVWVIYHLLSPIFHSQSLISRSTRHQSFTTDVTWQIRSLRLILDSRALSLGTFLIHSLQHIFSFFLFKYSVMALPLEVHLRCEVKWIWQKYFFVLRNSLNLLWKQEFGISLERRNDETSIKHLWNTLANMVHHMEHAIEHSSQYGIRYQT